MRIIYPYPMKISNGYTYMLSIAQFLNSLAKIVKIDLLCLDTKEEFTSYLKNKLDITLAPNLNIIQTSNKKLGIKSNRLFFNANVVKYIKSIDNNILKIIYTRDLKQMKELTKKRNLFENIFFVFEAHQILSQNLCKQGKYKNAKTIRNLEENVFNEVDILICITKTLKNEIKKSFSNATKKNLILPVGFNKRIISHKKEAILYDIIYTGSFVGWKGVSTLLEAISIISKKIKIKAILIGASDKEYTKYIDIVKKLDLGNSVEIKRKIPHKEIINFLVKSTIGVLPNVYEDDSLLFTSPLKLYEYLGAGLKIVCSRLPSIESSVNNDLIYWATAEDPSSLAKEILFALNDTTFDMNKVKKYSKEFTWEKRAHNFIACIKDELSE